MRAWVLAALMLSPVCLADQGLPLYPGSQPTRIGQDLEISGELYRMAYFVTPDPMTQVAQYFKEQWLEEGYPTTVDGTFEQEGVVSAFYTREGLVRSVVLRKIGGKTLALTVLKDLWTQVEPSAVPVRKALDGTVFSQDLVARDHTGATHRTALIERPLAATREALHRQLLGERFTLSKETSGKGERVLEYTRGAEQVVATLSEVEKGLTALSETWVKELER